MPRVIINKATGRIGEFQSDATKGTLLKNITANGGNKIEFEERVVTFEEYEALFASDPTRIAEREIASEGLLIAKRAGKIQKDRDRKKAVTELKVEGKTFNHFDANGNPLPANP